MSTNPTDVAPSTSRKHLVQQLRKTRFKQSWVPIPSPKGGQLRKLEEGERQRVLIFHEIEKRKEKQKQDNDNHKCSCGIQ